MNDRKFVNQFQPQTLFIATVLLYINAVFDFLSFIPLFMLAAVALAAGGYGIANEKKLGYQIAVVASFIPLAIRLLIFLTGNETFRFVLFSTSILNVLFEYALIALLLHPMSREHQKIWFR